MSVGTRSGRFDSPINYALIQVPNNRIVPRSRYEDPRHVTLKSSAEWARWEEVTLTIYGIHQADTTFGLWKAFAAEGNVVFIELYEGGDGRKDGKGKIRFSPPPNRAFWLQNQGQYGITLEDGTMHNVRLTLQDRKPGRHQIQSPIKKHIFYDPKMKIFPSSIEIGIKSSPQAMMALRTILPTAPNDISFTVDLKRRRIVAAFKVSFIDPQQKVTGIVGEHNRTNRYMFEIPFGQLKSITRWDIDQESFSLLINLESPPQYYRKREHPTTGHSTENSTWSEFDTWYRQTDIVYNPLDLSSVKVALHKEEPEIDIGRWTSYLFNFENSRVDSGLFQEIKNALQDFNIEMVTVDQLEVLPACPTNLWSLLDPPVSDAAGVQLEYLELNNNSLPFEVRYQLEVCISRDVFNEYNITKEFITALSKFAVEPERAKSILEYATEQAKRIYNPMTIFSDADALAYSPHADIPHYCAFTRKATVTPSTLYFSSPTVETTNRVLRHYSRQNEEGRFLRVQFTDELSEGRINSCADKQRNDEIYSRVFRTLVNGIQIGDRHYQFLAFGNSQFRENGAYFFCQTPHLSCDDIRAWMGSFSHINVVAKYAARLGQCFSTTRAINGLSHPKLVEIPDVERNGFCFTDGVGMISPFMAAMIAVELGHITPASAFQFRLGGCKGIVTVWPEIKDKDIHIRPSQHKFKAIYNGLEIIRCARFSSATLNRQTILILTALGVPDQVFLDMMSEQLAEIHSAMSNHELAINLLYSHIDDTQMTLNIAAMIRYGFMAEQEPFVLSLLHLWRAWSIKLLKEKAKIVVHKGAFVLGCTDETGILRGYTKPVDEKLVSVEELPQIFLQVPEKQDLNRYNVIEGICLVGRNPSLHPGDLRVVEAVNVPELHHLRDVVVFPQTGDRDVPSMCSGGDLDGDDFFVLWDKDLQPREWNCEPMDYAAPQPKSQKRAVVVEDMVKFFVRFMKNDSLPTIAHAHLAQGDFLAGGVKNPKCIELAKLHSKAVDYVKTGQPAEMPKRLKPRKWPHFMEKKFKSKDAQYHSTSILGQLYDQVESVDFVPQWQMPFDKRVLRAYKDQLSDSLLKLARQTKSQYDTAMRRMLANLDIKTEFELWSTFVLSKPRVGSDYKQQEEVARQSDAHKERFRQVCIAKAGGKDFTTLGPFVAAMYKVTKEEMDMALAECRTMKTVGGRSVPKRKMEPKSMPLISFPWLFEKELGRIASGIDTSEEADLAPLTLRHDGTSRKRRGAGEAVVEDFVVQEDGAIVHRGEELDLFRPDPEEQSEASSDDDDDDHSAREEYPYTMGESGELVMSQDFKSWFPGEQYIPGTSYDDFLPRIEFDGLHATEAKDTLVDLNQLLDPDISTLLTTNETPTKTRTVKEDTPTSGSSATDQEVECQVVEEEDIKLNISESPMDRLARLTTKSYSSEEDLDEELVEEVVELQLGETSMERLARMTGS